MRRRKLCKRILDAHMMRFAAFPEIQLNPGMRDIEVVMCVIEIFGHDYDHDEKKNFLITRDHDREIDDHADHYIRGCQSVKPIHCATIAYTPIGRISQCGWHGTHVSQYISYISRLARTSCTFYI